MISKNRTDNVNFATPWPTDDPGISRRQSREIQQALLDRGYDIGAADEMIGDKTRQAIQTSNASKASILMAVLGMKLYRMLVVDNATAPMQRCPHSKITHD